MRTIVLVAMLVGSAYAQLARHSVSHSGAQQGVLTASTEPSHGGQKEYESWVRPYRQSPTVDALDSSGHTIATPALLAITVVRERDLPVDVTPTRTLGNNNRAVTYTWTVSPDGRISYFYSNSTGIGGLNPDLTKKELLELSGLLQQLPDDHSRLPPAGRRLVIRTPAADGAVVRVYDRAHLPGAVLEIVRIARVHFATWSIDFPPEKTGSLAEFAQMGLQVRWPRATSPDGFLEATQSPYEVVISSPSKGELHWLREPEVNRHIDGLFGPFFSPDGRFLLVQSTHPAIRIYDTRNWEQVQTLPGLSPDVVGYFPDKNWKLAVFATSKGAVGLWDSQERKQIASFASNAELMDVAFSPDESLVAVALRRKREQSSGLHIKIWRVDGTPLSALEPWNQIVPLGLSAFSKIAGLLAWWSDNEHLFTIVHPDEFSDNKIAIWNVKTGRYEGDLSGCPGSIDRFAVSTQDGRVFAECHSNGLRMWNAAAAIDRTTKFEQSSPAQNPNDGEHIESGIR